MPRKPCMYARNPSTAAAPVVEPPSKAKSPKKGATRKKSVAPAKKKVNKKEPKQPVPNFDETVVVARFIGATAASTVL